MGSQGFNVSLGGELRLTKLCGITGYLNFTVPTCQIVSEYDQAPRLQKKFILNSAEHEVYPAHIC